MMLEHLTDNISRYTLAHANMGLLFAFLIAFAESLPIIGTIIPGSVTMTLIGILVGRGMLPLSITLLLAFLGAILGDVFGFWIGKHYQDRIGDVWPFKKYTKFRKLITMGEALFKKHGGKSIIIGRFLGPTRSSVPMIAGLLKMRWANFIMAAIPSALLWALLYLMPGVIIGTISLTLPKKQATLFSFIGLAVVAFLWLFFWLIKRLTVYSARAIDKGIATCWNWCRTSQTANTIVRFIARRDNPEDHLQLTLLATAILLALVFVITLTCVTLYIGLYHLNSPIFHLSQALRSPQLDQFSIVLSVLGNKFLLASVYLLLIAFLTFRKQGYIVWHLSVILITSFGAIWLIKHLVFFSRPSGFVYVDPTSSFPSGHATLSISLLGFLTFLVTRCLKTKWHWVPYSVTSLLVIFVASSRLILGVHWFCDVLAGWCLGGSLLMLAIMSYRRSQPTFDRPGLVLNIIVLSTALLWACYAAFHYSKFLPRYQPLYTQQTIDEQKWWHQPTKHFPLYLKNRLGHATQPFNLQWSGQEKIIEKLLENAGWQHAKSKENLKSVLERFSSKMPAQHLAFLPQLYQGRRPALFMIKTIPKQLPIIELRLWRTNYHLSNSKQPIFLGTLNKHNPARSLIDLKPHQQISLSGDAGVKELLAAVNQHFQSKTIILTLESIPIKVDKLGWNQKILILRPEI